MDIQYLPIDVPLKYDPLWFHLKGLMQTATGYGLKLSSVYSVFYKGRRRRVYITCISNAGTAWIKIGKQKLFLHDSHPLPTERK